MIDGDLLEDLRQKLKDRFDIYELVDLLEIDVDDLLFEFSDNIFEHLDDIYEVLGIEQPEEEEGN